GNDFVIDDISLAPCIQAGQSTQAPQSTTAPISTKQAEPVTQGPQSTRAPISIIKAQGVCTDVLRIPLLPHTFGADKAEYSTLASAALSFSTTCTERK
ncbi:unnamed protein product, partial [Didymodactylos carnosus]